MTQLGMTDPTVQRMLKRGIPLTRENWIYLAWPEMPEEMDSGTRGGDTVLSQGILGELPRNPHPEGV